MSIKSIMNKRAAVCTEDMPLEQVFQLMDEGSADHVSVVENYAHRKPIGLITEHDICRHIVGRGRSPRGLTAASVMDTRIIKTEANQSLADCATLFESCNSKTLLIVDENGTLSGTISRRDLEFALSAERAAIVPGKPMYASYHVAMDRIF